MVYRMTFPSYDKFISSWNTLPQFVHITSSSYPIIHVPCFMISRSKQPVPIKWLLNKQHTQLLVNYIYIYTQIQIHIYTVHLCISICMYIHILYIYIHISYVSLYSLSYISQRIFTCFGTVNLPAARPRRSPRPGPACPWGPWSSSAVSGCCPRPVGKSGDDWIKKHHHDKTESSGCIYTYIYIITHRLNQNT